MGLTKFQAFKTACLLAFIFILCSIQYLSLFPSSDFFFFWEGRKYTSRKNVEKQKRKKKHDEGTDRTLHSCKTQYCRNIERLADKELKIYIFFNRNFPQYCLCTCICMLHTTLLQQRQIRGTVHLHQCITCILLQQQQQQQW